MVQLSETMSEWAPTGASQEEDAVVLSSQSLCLNAVNVACHVAVNTSMNSR